MKYCLVSKRTGFKVKDIALNTVLWARNDEPAPVLLESRESAESLVKQILQMEERPLGWEVCYIDEVK